MRLFRVFPRHLRASRSEPGHALYVPCDLQGGGRHDNPDLYGALYLSETPIAAVAEQLAHLRGQLLEESDLERGGLRLALAELDAPLEKTCLDRVRKLGGYASSLVAELSRGSVH